LASRQPFRAPIFRQRLPSLPSQLYITLRRLPAALIEGVQYVHSLRKLRDVQHSVLKRRVDPNLTDARPDHRHRLPVRRIESLLDTPQLKPSESPRVARELANVSS
jgi:hypothetical protein